MKILIINASDIRGGAGRATYRLHKSLLAQNIDSQMLVQDKLSDDFTVKTVNNTKMKKIFSKIRSILDTIPIKIYKNRTKTLFSPSFIPSGNTINMINEINPDIVHLHWICASMLKIDDIANIKAPVVWSLHDNWAFTGGCHIMWECDRYLTKCNYCPRLGSDSRYDISRLIFNKKKRTFEKKDNLTIVGLSRWVNNCSKKSTLLKDKRHINLPNPIDTKIFKPFNKKKSRELWGLPQNKKVVLFGANRATSDINKGFKELSETLHKLKNRDIELVIFGSSEPKESQNFGFRTHYLGHLFDDVSLVTLYGAVDVMLVPSLQENLSNVIMESLACGTPVVGFDIGGNSDMIEHKKNGYLSKPFDTDDLKKGIEWVLDNPNYDELSKNAEKKVLREFESSIVSKKYIKLYEEILFNVK
jgi:glycosyltransferase involved in cell wall biosynthesis